MDKETKEKISEMAHLCEGCLEKSYRDIEGCWDCENRGTYNGAMKMAEWKEHQMIEKTAKWLDSITYLMPEEERCKLINDYKQAMKEE